VPLLKLYERSELRRDVWNLMLVNTRLPQLVGGDIHALMSACRVGHRRILELRDRYCEHALIADVEALLDPTALRMREEVSRVGEASTARPPHLPPRRRRRGRPSAPGFLRHRSAGLSLLQPPSTANFVMSDVVGDAIMTALAEAMPDRVTTGWGRAMNANFRGVVPGDWGDVLRVPAALEQGRRRSRRRHRRLELHRAADLRWCFLLRRGLRSRLPGDADPARGLGGLGRRGGVARGPRYRPRVSAAPRGRDHDLRGRDGGAPPERSIERVREDLAERLRPHRRGDGGVRRLDP
jgi:hypothetical protein